MKRVMLKWAGIGLVAVAMVASGCARVRPSFSGVLVNNWASDDKGAIQPQGRGLVWYNPITQDLYIFPLHIQQQNYTLEGEDPITVRSGKDNTTVSFDATLDCSSGVVQSAPFACTPMANGMMSMKFSTPTPEITNMNCSGGMPTGEVMPQNALTFCCTE